MYVCKEGREIYFAYIPDWIIIIITKTVELFSTSSHFQPSKHIPVNRDLFSVPIDIFPNHKSIFPFFFKKNLKVFWVFFSGRRGVNHPEKRTSKTDFCDKDRPQCEECPIIF